MYVFLLACPSFCTRHMPDISPKSPLRCFFSVWFLQAVIWLSAPLSFPLFSALLFASCVSYVPINRRSLLTGTGVISIMTPLGVMVILEYSCQLQGPHLFLTVGWYLCWSTLAMRHLALLCNKNVNIQSCMYVHVYLTQRDLYQSNEKINTSVVNGDTTDWHVERLWHQ